ncbi:MAG: hypothetical protein U5L96_16765 [Owenweeksia sp.]|nr:hypothetical protein [Owenweeksia sp.]
MDCAGVAGGTAFLNECDSCVGGTSGNPVNYGKDDCGICNGNNTDKDCFGDCFGTAVLDSCGDCTLGNTNLVFNGGCNIDCHGDLNGTASLDDCGVCSGGNTGMTPNANKDTCGVCYGNNLSCATCVPIEIISLNLVSVSTGADLDVLYNGYVINKAVVGDFSIRANVCHQPSVGSVQFFVDGNLIQTENKVPYAMQGDKGGNYSPWNPIAGSYQVTVTPYSNSNGSGATGVAISYNIIVLDAQSIDCNGDTLGTAFLNDCNECVSGNTGKSVDFGKDNCGVCNGNNADKDCAGVVFWYGCNGRLW